MNVFDFDNTIYDGESVIDFFMYYCKKDKSLLKYIPTVMNALVKYKKGSDLQGLENVLYACPHCGSEFSMIVKQGDSLYCESCGYCQTSDEFGFLHKASEHGQEIRYVSDWSKQIFSELKERLSKGENTVLSAKTAIHMVDPQKKKYVPVGNGMLTLSPERFLIEGTLKGEEISLTIPIAAFPGIGASIRTPEVARLIEISSTRLAIARTRMPASGTTS